MHGSLVDTLLRRTDHAAVWAGDISMSHEARTDYTMIERDVQSRTGRTAGIPEKSTGRNFLSSNPVQNIAAWKVPFFPIQNNYTQWLG